MVGADPWPGVHHTLLTQHLHHLLPDQVLFGILVVNVTTSSVEFIVNVTITASVEFIVNMTITALVEFIVNVTITALVEFVVNVTTQLLWSS